MGVDGEQDTEAELRQELSRLQRRNAGLELDKQFLERILDSITDPIFVKDHEHRLVFVNDAKCRLTGHGRESSLGKTDYDFHSEEEADVFWSKDALVLRTGMEDVNEEEVTDAQGLKRVIATKKTLYVDGQEQKFIVGIIRDITERKRAENALRDLAGQLERKVVERTAALFASRQALEKDIEQRIAVEQALSAETERLKVTLRSIADGVIATDVDGKLLLMNRVAETLTGFCGEEAVGQPLASILRLRHEKTQADFPIALNELLEGSGSEIAEPLLLLPRTGAERVVLISAAPILNAHARALGVVVVFHDITERRRFEEQFADAQRLESLGVLAAGIAHDFNNLLSGIFGNVEIALLDMSESDGARVPLHAALGLLDRARALSSQLITFAKGGAPITKVTSLRALLEQCTAFFLSGSQIASTLTIEDNLRPSELDENQIAQAINNVLLNAQQAMPTGGYVHIDASNYDVNGRSVLPLRPGPYVKIQIRDCGVGMDTSVRERVFDPFFTTKAKGNGLGLTMVFSIVKRHGGHVTIDSAPMAGTTISIFLPAVPTDCVQAETVSPAEPVGAPGHVLVVDDEPFVRDVVTRLLQALGWQVTTTASGSEALSVLRNALTLARPFDLALIDLTLPGEIDGVETVRRLQEVDPSLRAIASSGYADAAAMASPTSFGFSGALAKPYTVTQLAAALAAATSGPQAASVSSEPEASRAP